MSDKKVISKIFVSLTTTGYFIKIFHCEVIKETPKKYRVKFVNSPYPDLDDEMNFQWIKKDRINWVKRQDHNLHKHALFGYRAICWQSDETKIIEEIKKKISDIFDAEFSRYEQAKQFV